MLADLDARFPLAGRVITAGALQTQRRLAELICRELLAHYLAETRTCEVADAPARIRMMFPHAR